MYTLNPAKVGVATDNLRTFSILNTRVYNGVDGPPGSVRSSTIRS